MADFPFSWEKSPWRRWLVDSHFTSPGYISSTAPYSSLLGLPHTPCLQPVGAKHTVQSPLASPHHVKTQTGFSFFSSTEPQALWCFSPAQGTWGTKHCRAHLGSVLKWTLLPHLGPTLRAGKRQFQDLKRKEQWLACRTIRRVPNLHYLQAFKSICKRWFPAYFSLHHGASLETNEELVHLDLVEMNGFLYTSCLSEMSRFN